MASVLRKSNWKKNFRALLGCRQTSCGWWKREAKIQERNWKLLEIRFSFESGETSTRLCRKINNPANDSSVWTRFEAICSRWTNIRHNIKLCSVIAMLLSCKCFNVNVERAFELNYWNLWINSLCKYPSISCLCIQLRIIFFFKLQGWANHSERKFPSRSL